MDGTKLTTEMEQLKNKLRATWMSGDFGRIATSFEAGAVEFVERLDLKSGQLVLDVACGTGNLAIPAAKAGASVAAIDIAPDLVDQAIALASAAGVDIEFDVGDAESMPYEDDSFGVVMSMFGAMFAPRPEVAAEEMKRVCRPGGFIAMANWTASGFIGQMFKITGKHVTPPQGMPSPILWGDEETVRGRFAEGISDLTLTPRTIDFIFPFGPEEVVEQFRMFYGPTLKAFESLGADTDASAGLRRDLEELWGAHNKADDGTTLVTSEYLEVRAVRA